MKAKQSQIMNEVRTLLETLIRTDDSAKLGSMKEFIRGTYMRVVEEMKPKAKIPKANQYPEYTQFVEIWHKVYAALGFTAVDGAKIKSLIAKTKQYIHSQGGEVTSEHSINFWMVFVNNLQKTWYHGKDLGVIESKYYAIIYEMKNGKRKDSYGSRASDARRTVEGM